MHSYYLATHYDPMWYKAQHTWALAHFDVVSYLESQPENKASDVPPENLAVHITQAIKGTSIKPLFLVTSSTIVSRTFYINQPSKREHSPGHSTVTHAVVQVWRPRRRKPGDEHWLRDGRGRYLARSNPSGEYDGLHLFTNLIVWQIIARIQTPSANIRRNINRLLTEVGKHHPQAMVYSLTVASKSSSATRKNAAESIMNHMKDHSEEIVKQVCATKLGTSRHC